MQPDPVDSTKMVSAADHGWDEQDQYESERICNQELERLRGQAFLDSLQRKRETGEGLNRMVIKALEDVGNNHHRGTDSAYNDMPEETSRDGSSSSVGTDFTLSGGNNHHRETDSPSNDMPAVILDSAAQANSTGNFNVLSNLSMGPKNVVLVAANRQQMETYMSGSVRLERFELDDVHYCPELGNRTIVSGSMLDNDDYAYEFGRGKCSVTDLRSGRTVGEGCLLDGDYVLNYLKIPRDRTPGLVTRMWNAVCSALHRLGLNPQGPPM